MNPYEKILKEVASGMLETAEKRQKFSNNAMADAMLIFQTVLMDKMYEVQEYNKMEMRYRNEMAEACGKELRKLIHTFAGLDTVELVNNYEKL